MSQAELLLPTWSLLSEIFEMCRWCFYSVECIGIVYLTMRPWWVQNVFLLKNVFSPVTRACSLFTYDEIYTAMKLLTWILTFLHSTFVFGLRCVPSDVSRRDPWMAVVLWYVVCWTVCCKDFMRKIKLKWLRSHVPRVFIAF